MRCRTGTGEPAAIRRRRAGAGIEPAQKAAALIARSFRLFDGSSFTGDVRAATYRRAPSYGAKIFKGAKPGGLPVEQPARFERVVNLKTARALGIKVPQTILLQPTKMIK